MSKLKNIINHKKVVLKLAAKGAFNWMSDEDYLKLVFKVRTGKKLDFNNPVGYNQKLQFLKLYDRKSEYTKLVDKYEVRSYISEKIGDKYLIPLVGVYESVEEIDYSKFPEKFVLKSTHDSGGVVICQDKSKFNKEEAERKINKSLKNNYYYWGREWPYKNVPPRIICEEFLEDYDGRAPKDYKFFCFNGEPKLIQVDIDRFGNHKQNFYDANWNLRDVKIHKENDMNANIKKPEKLEEMLDIVRKLSAGFPHIRVDLYDVKGEIIFGELTFYHMTGMSYFKTPELEKEMGEWLSLESVKKGEIFDAK